jgi:hypothetical protein
MNGQMPASEHAAPTAAELLEELEIHLQSELDGRVHEVSLAYRDDGIVLSGVTHTYLDRQLAQQVLENATELPIVANEIEVR